MILVFKTNIKNKKQVNGIKTELDANLPDVKWNFDLEDCDNIFRVETTENITNTIINLFCSSGYNCEELMD